MNLPNHFDLHWDCKTTEDLGCKVAEYGDVRHLMDSMVDEIRRLQEEVKERDTTIYELDERILDLEILT